MKPQVAEALNKAHEHRLARAALRAEVSALPRGEAVYAIADLIENPPNCIWTLEAFKLIQWCNRTGLYRARGICRGAGVSELALTGYLTQRQRNALCSALRAEEQEVAA